MSETPAPDPFLTPERAARLAAVGFEGINTVPQAGCVLIRHTLPVEGVPTVFAFLVRLNRPEWAGWTPLQMFEGIEALILQGIEMRRQAVLGA